ncbi:hypothetical protein ACLOJK_000280 [Asimina triloba]
MPPPSYHPPQFSEDSAWLPAWLQPHQLPFSVQQIEADQPISPASCKDKISNGAEGNFSEGAGRYSGCRLFLSGDDSSPMSSTPSGNSPASGQSHDAYQSERCKSSKSLYNKMIPEVSVFRDDIVSRACVEDLMGSTYLPKVLQESFPPSLSKDNSKSGKKIQRKFDSGHLQKTDILDAVELSIAASEALAISEMLNMDSPEIFSAATILEIGLRVKHARNQYHDGLVYEPSCTTDDFDETDQLSNMDENTLLDAFEDVGLSVTKVATFADDFGCCHTYPSKDQNNSCNSSINKKCGSYVISSHVLNIEAPENQSVCDGEVATESRSKDVQQECHGMWEITYGDGLSGSYSNRECHWNADSNQIVQTTADHLAATEISSKEDGTSLKIHVKEDAISSSSIAVSKKAVVKIYFCSCSVFIIGIDVFIFTSFMLDAKNAINGTKIFMTDRFRSRWFGGWTAKDVEAPVCEGEKNRKNMLNGAEVPICEGQNTPKFFTGETSFLSESMDAFSDENSIHNPDSGFKKVALSCTPVVAIPGNADEGVMVSQGVVGSSNFSMEDPLCSIVPCSISLDEDDTIQPPVEKILEEVEKGSNLKDYLGLETVCSMPPVQGEENVASRMSKEGSTEITRKQLTSLRMYSMLEPASFVSAAGKLVSFNELGPLVDCSVSPNKEDSTFPLECRQSERKKPNLVNYGNNGTSHTKKLLLEPTVRNNSEVTDDVDMVQVCQFEQGPSPVILNCGTRHRLRAHKIVANDTEKGPDMPLISSKRKFSIGASGAGVSVMDQTTDGFSLLESSLHSHAHANLKTATKRVRFAEPEVKWYCSKTIKRPSVGHQGSCKRTGKRPHKLGSMFVMEREDYNCLKGCCTKCRKEFLFQGIEFLLTGCSRKKEKELEILIRKHGGCVLSNVPPLPRYLSRKRESRQQHRLLPIVLSSKKVLLRAVPFLVLGVHMAVWCQNVAFILCHDFTSPTSTLSVPLHLVDAACCYYLSAFLPFPLLSSPNCDSSPFHTITSANEMVGRCHGGGQVFKSLHSVVQSLKKGNNSVGIVVFEDESRALRHLKHCASEQQLQFMPASWIINSLYMGKLLPFKNNVPSASAPMVRRVGIPPSMDLSEEV